MREESVVEVSFGTSRGGVLWPTGHWKELVDSLARGGLKKDPRVEYPDLAKALGSLIEVRGGRYCPRLGTALCELDDTDVRVIRVRRVRPGFESVAVGLTELPDTASWSAHEFTYFGTIGNSKYEAQSKLNQAELGRSLPGQPDLGVLNLSFAISTERKDRDLDNLLDGLAPFFNKAFPSLDEIVLVKENRSARVREVLRHHLGPWSSQVVAKGVATDS